MEIGVNMNLYKYFFAVTESQNVSRAGEKLRVSQPSVSYNLHALQRELGKQLFVIERHGIVPTPQARALYRRLKPVYVAFLRIVNEFMQGQK